jgi:hypothetical protein
VGPSGSQADGLGRSDGGAVVAGRGRCGPAFLAKRRQQSQLRCFPAAPGPTPAASPERLSFLRAKATEGRLPQWTTWWGEDEVALLFPDEQTRLKVSAEQPRLPLSYYEQQIPVPDGWDNRPSGYLLFGPPYDHMAQDARERGWDVEHVPGQHLHQLIDPDTVTARIAAMSHRRSLSAD